MGGHFQEAPTQHAQNLLPSGAPCGPEAARFLITYVPLITPKMHASVRVSLEQNTRKNVARQHFVCGIAEKQTTLRLLFCGTAGRSCQRQDHFLQSRSLGNRSAHTRRRGQRRVVRVGCGSEVGRRLSTSRESVFRVPCPCRACACRACEAVGAKVEARIGVCFSIFSLLHYSMCPCFPLPCAFESQPWLVFLRHGRSLAAGSKHVAKLPGVSQKKKKHHTTLHSCRGVWNFPRFVFVEFISNPIKQMFPTVVDNFDFIFHC